MFVLLADLGFVGISVVCVYSMCVWVQLEQKGIRHHYSDEEQEQKHSNMSQEAVHFSY